MDSVVSDALLHGLNWKQLRRVQKATGWGDKELADRMGYTLRDFYRKRAGNKPVMAHSSIILAEQLQVDLPSLFYGKVDFVALERHFHGNADYLPERYQAAAFSRMRTSVHLLDYCDTHLGTALTEVILRRYQVKRAAFSDPHRFISIQFLMDACEFLSQNVGRDPALFREIGMQSAAVSKRTPVSSILGQSRSVRELYDIQINTLMELFDKNFHYRTIALTEDYCVIESIERQQVKDAFHGAMIGNLYTCMTRVGVAAAISGSLDLPFGVVEKTHCIHQGDSRCLFRVDYRQARAHLQKAGRPSLRLVTQPLAESPAAPR